jgi:hypothetical protein
LPAFCPLLHLSVTFFPSFIPPFSPPPSPTPSLFPLTRPSRSLLLSYFPFPLHFDFASSVCAYFTLGSIRPPPSSNSYPIPYSRSARRSFSLLLAPSSPSAFRSRSRSPSPSLGLSFSHSLTPFLSLSQRRENSEQHRVGEQVSQYLDERCCVLG